MTRIRTDECPTPRGMNNNIETSYECGADIGAQPLTKIL